MPPLRSTNTSGGEMAVEYSPVTNQSSESTVPWAGWIVGMQLYDFSRRSHSSTSQNGCIWELCIAGVSVSRLILNANAYIDILSAFAYILKLYGLEYKENLGS